MFIFPEQFYTGKLPAKPDNMPDEDYHKRLIADALCAWGIAMMGQKPPDNFGKAMAEIQILTNVDMEPEALLEYAKTLA